LNNIPVENLEKFLSFAVDAAIGAGKVTLEYFQKEIKIDRKDDMTPVTIADRQAEEYIRGQIEESFPEHSILGEEAGENPGESPFRWIIDPIDGTQSFIRGVSQYTVLLALEYNGVPVLGVIHNPPQQETVSAATGIGAFYNGTACNVSSTKHLADAWVDSSY